MAPVCRDYFRHQYDLADGLQGGEQRTHQPVVFFVEYLRDSHPLFRWG